MKGPRAFCFVFALAALLCGAASAQTYGHAPGANPNQSPIPDKSASPRAIDPEAYDSIDLYSRLCVSTRGDRARAVAIVGSGDSAIETMDAPLLRGLENGKSGGIGWIIRMPLGDRILLEFPPDGTCIVRAPRVKVSEMENAFRNLLDQFSASGQFVVHRVADQTQSYDAPPGNPGDKHMAKAGEKMKFHVLAYHMTLPDSDRPAELVLATTDSPAANIQATMSFVVMPDSAEKPAN
ncbi:MAG TPA: hypothetical protein VH722_10270 [Alphaproteobacteria bacterium]|jgi:hypothetical protein|nr:hypothetical protein [Alphaproteobacteria bacterium]